VWEWLCNVSWGGCGFRLEVVVCTASLTCIYWKILMIHIGGQHNIMVEINFTRMVC